MLLGRLRRLAVFALQDGLRPLQLAFGRDALDDLVGHAPLLQVPADLGGSILAGKRTSAFFSEALVRKLLLRLQEINNGIQCCFRLRVRRELADQLGPRVLAPHEVSQRPRFQLRGRVRLVFQPSLLRFRVGRRSTFLSSGSSATTAAADPAAFTPALSRILASISLASASFSLRKSRELSLPWPRRSPL